MAQFINPFPGMIPDEKMNNDELIRALRQDLAAEEEATHLYTAHAEATNNSVARKILLDIGDEEKVHAGEFLRLIEMFSGNEGEFVLQGAKEVDEKTEGLRSPLTVSPDFNPQNPLGISHGGDGMLGKAIVVSSVIKTLFKPASPEKGPPLPESFGVSWPGFLKKGIENLKKSVG